MAVCSRLVLNHFHGLGGGQLDVGVVADAVDTAGVLHDDLITGAILAPVREVDCCGYTATAIVLPR